MTSEPGIYRIVVTRGNNPPKYYIGQASNLERRRKEHLWRLKSRACNNRVLQCAYDKYGVGAFHFEVLATCVLDKALLQSLEQAALDKQIADTGDDSIYNIHRQCVGTPIGVVRSIEIRRRQSESLRGKRRSPEDVAAMAARMRGKKLSPESICKRSLKQKGRVQSPEERAKRSAIMTGKKHSPEACAKIAAAKKGSGPPPEHMEKLRLANIGRKKDPESVERGAAKRRGSKRSPDSIARFVAARRENGTFVVAPETREKIAASLRGCKRSTETIAKLKGRVFSEEHRRKLSAAAKARAYS